MNRFRTAAKVNSSEEGLDSTIWRPCHFLISAVSNAVLNLQLCIMNLTALNHWKRRRKRLKLLLMLKDLRKRTNGRRFPRARLLWIRPGRCNEWWDNFITQRVTAEEWKENFRTNRETFLKLCDDLRPSVNDLFQFWAVSVHTMPKCFSCRHEKPFGIV